VPVSCVLSAWGAMQSGEISLYCLRVWVACIEMVARRCCIEDGVEPSYSESEVLKLVGSGQACKVKKSLKRLQEAGLLEWSTKQIRVDVAHRPLAPWIEAKVKNVRRNIPVPRRMLRHMAGCRSRVMIATLLGHLVRCLYYRKGCCVSGGKCKASFVAQVFGVHVRGVKRARKALVEMGWLVPDRTSQQALNRWGMQVIIRVQRVSEGVEYQTNSPPRSDGERGESATPILYNKLSARSMNQKLRRAGGVEMGSGERKRVTLTRIRLDDLREPDRLDGLYRAAVASGVIRRNAASRLQWFAAAEHALAAGDRNPCGLFVTVYKRALWEYITQEQEDAARVKLKRLDYGEESSLRGGEVDLPPDYFAVAA